MTPKALWPHALTCLLLVACGGGGGATLPSSGEPPAVAALAGSWLGTWRNPDTSAYESFRIDFDEAGTILEIVKGGVPDPASGTVTHLEVQIFRILLTTGDRGTLALETSGQYAGLFLEVAESIPLQKGATALPSPFPESMVFGRSFRGPAATMSVERAILTSADSAITLQADGSFSGYVADTTFSGSGATWHEMDGRLQALHLVGTGVDGVLWLRVAPDGGFAVGGAMSVDLVGEPCCDGRVYFLWTLQ